MQLNLTIKHISYKKNIYVPFVGNWNQYKDLQWVDSIMRHQFYVVVRIQSMIDMTHVLYTKTFIKMKEKRYGAAIFGSNNVIFKWLIKTIK